MTNQIATGTMWDERFRILKFIGSGGTGSVYLAEQLGLDRKVAVKILRTDLEVHDSDKQRFLNEGKILCRLEHESIAEFYHFGISSDRQPYIAMEFVSGETVAQLLAEQRKLPWRRALSIALLVARAMAVCHKQGILHRDLKPDNILIRNDNPDRICILDFGFAAFEDNGAGQRLTETGFIVGTVCYMSPEQCKGRRGTAQSDIYSLGCILYEMLCGETPFSSLDPMAIMRMHMMQTAAPLSSRVQHEHDIPEGLDFILEQSLAKHAGDRYSNMDSLAEDIELLLDGRSAELLKEQNKRKLVHQKETFTETMCAKWRGITAGACVAIASAGLVVVFTHHDTDVKQPQPSLVRDHNILKRVQEELQTHDAGHAEKALNEWLDASKPLGLVETQQSCIAYTMIARAELDAHHFDKVVRYITLAQQAYDNQSEQDPTLLLPILAYGFRIERIRSNVPEAIKKADQLEQLLSSGVKFRTLSAVQAWSQLAKHHLHLEQYPDSLRCSEHAVALSSQAGARIGPQIMANVAMVHARALHSMHHEKEAVDELINARKLAQGLKRSNRYRGFSAWERAQAATNMASGTKGTAALQEARSNLSDLTLTTSYELTKLQQIKASILELKLAILEAQRDFATDESYQQKLTEMHPQLKRKLDATRSLLIEAQPSLEFACDLSEIAIIQLLISERANADATIGIVISSLEVSDDNNVKTNIAKLLKQRAASWKDRKASSEYNLRKDIAILCANVKHSDFTDNESRVLDDLAE